MFVLEATKGNFLTKTRGPVTSLLHAFKSCTGRLEIGISSVLRGFRVQYYKVKVEVLNCGCPKWTSHKLILKPIFFNLKTYFLFTFIGQREVDTSGGDEGLGKLRSLPDISI